MRIAGIAFYSFLHYLSYPLFRERFPSKNFAHFYFYVYLCQQSFEGCPLTLFIVKFINIWESVSIQYLLEKIYELLALILRSENRQFEVSENKQVKVHVLL